MRKTESLTLSGRIEFDKLIQNYQLSSYDMIDISIGNDAKIYCLFATTRPERTNRMFVSTKNRPNYKAVAIDIDWYSGDYYSSMLLDFGQLELNVHFIQPLEDHYLLLGARAALYEDGTSDQNAVIFNSWGKQISSFCFGDGIEQCMVDSQNNIIIGYFDEGVYGNYGWNDPIGANGLIKWSAYGKKLWENRKYSISDCYALNIDGTDNLWFYYYTDFLLVKTDYLSDAVYNPKINGSHGFLINQSQDKLLMDKGYDHYGQFYMFEVLADGLSNPIDYTFAYADKIIQTERFAFRSSKAVFFASDRYLYFLNWY